MLCVLTPLRRSLEVPISECRGKSRDGFPDTEFFPMKGFLKREEESEPSQGRCHTVILCLVPFFPLILLTPPHKLALRCGKKIGRT